MVIVWKEQLFQEEFQMISGVEDAKDLFDGKEYYAVTFVKE